MRKMTEEETTTKLEKRLEIFQRFVNQIDDYFEYRYKSKEDQAEVHRLLEVLYSSLEKTKGTPSTEDSFDALERRVLEEYIVNRNAKRVLVQTSLTDAMRTEIRKEVRVELKALGYKSPKRNEREIR